MSDCWISRQLSSGFQRTPTEYTFCRGDRPSARASPLCSRLREKCTRLVRRPGPSASASPRDFPAARSATRMDFDRELKDRLRLRPVALGRQPDREAEWSWPLGGFCPDGSGLYSEADREPAGERWDQSAQGSDSAWSSKNSTTRCRSIPKTARIRQARNWRADQARDLSRQAVLQTAAIVERHLLKRRVFGAADDLPRGIHVDESPGAVGVFSGSL